MWGKSGFVEMTEVCVAVDERCMQLPSSLRGTLRVETSASESMEETGRSHMASVQPHKTPHQTIYLTKPCHFLQNIVKYK